MQEEIIAWLNDIEKAIEEINSFLPSPRLFSSFQSDLKTKRAVERNIEIIGEAYPERSPSHSDKQLT